MLILDLHISFHAIVIFGFGRAFLSKYNPLKNPQENPLPKKKHVMSVGTHMKQQLLIFLQNMSIFMSMELTSYFAAKRKVFIDISSWVTVTVQITFFF